MVIRDATPDDFDIAFDFIEQLWTYNSYDRDTIRRVYREVLGNAADFAVLLFDDGVAQGFCHGTFFNTFWLSGQTCYLSSLITRPEARGRGYGRALVDHVRTVAGERGCRAIVLDSGIPRTDAHRFYEKYGFKRCAYCYELKL